MRRSRDGNVRYDPAYAPGAAFFRLRRLTPPGQGVYHLNSNNLFSYPLEDAVMLPFAQRRPALLLAALASVVFVADAGAQPRPGGFTGRPGSAVGNPGGAIGNPGGAIGNPGGAIGRPGGGIVTEYLCPICRAKIATKEFGANPPAPMQHCGRTITFDAFGSSVQGGGGNPGGNPGGFKPGGNPGGFNPGGGNPGGFDPWGSQSAANKAALDEAKETTKTVTGVTIAMGIGFVLFGLIMLAGAGFGAVQSQRRR